MITIINYGMGNIRSVQNKFRKMGENCLVSSSPEEIATAEKLILPGVGHFKRAMQNLEELELLQVLNKKVLQEHIPILGICLGAQLFARYSEEGDCNGLGWIDAEVVSFDVSDTKRFKVPHMGWNRVEVINKNALGKEINEDGQFYFVHSYHLKCRYPNDIWMTTNYDYEFVSAVHRGNVWGTQFHPEKSHGIGMTLLKEFVGL